MSWLLKRFLVFILLLVLTYLFGSLYNASFSWLSNYTEWDSDSRFLLTSWVIFCLVICIFTEVI